MFQLQEKREKIEIFDAVGLTVANSSILLLR